jgi:hypothetical protein
LVTKDKPQKQPISKNIINKTSSSHSSADQSSQSRQSRSGSTTGRSRASSAHRSTDRSRSRTSSVRGHEERNTERDSKKRLQSPDSLFVSPAITTKRHAPVTRDKMSTTNPEPSVPRSIEVVGGFNSTVDTTDNFVHPDRGRGQFNAGHYQPN